MDSCPNLENSSAPAEGKGKTPENGGDKDVPVAKVNNSLVASYIDDEAKRRSVLGTKKKLLMRQAWQTSTSCGAEVMVVVASGDSDDVFLYGTAAFDQWLTSPDGIEAISSCLVSHSMTSSNDSGQLEEKDEVSVSVKASSPFWKRSGRNFNCLLCGGKFKTLVLCQTHLRAHHNITNLSLITDPVRDSDGKDDDEEEYLGEATDEEEEEVAMLPMRGKRTSGRRKNKSVAQRVCVDDGDGSLSRAEASPAGAKNRTAFEIFCSETQPSGSSTSQPLDGMTATWKNMTDEEKNVYFEQEKEERRRVELEAKMQSARLRNKDGKQLGERVEGSRTIMQQPQRHASPFIWFAKNVQETVARENPEARLGERNKMVGAMWKELGEDGRKPYLELARADKLRYEKELAEWKAQNEGDDILFQHGEKDQTKQGKGKGKEKGEKKQKILAKKKKKTMKDPNAPKKPTTAYFCFAAENREAVQKRLGPQAKVPDVAKEMGRMWTSMSEVEKGRYYEMTAKDRERYHQEMEAYKKGGSSSGDKPLGSAANVDSRLDSNPDVPKKPAFAYMHFAMEKREEMKKQLGPEAKESEVGMAMGRMWATMSEAEKEKYVELAAKDKERYEREMDTDKRRVSSEEPDEEKIQEGE